MRPTRFPAPLALLLMLEACALGWRRIALPEDTVFAPRQQVQLWEGASPSVLHAVRVTRDSLRGVPFHQPPRCDSCAIALPRSAVDSVRLGNQETGGVFKVAIITLFICFLLIPKGGG
jgi:hypothetical protein